MAEVTSPVCSHFARRSESEHTCGTDAHQPVNKQWPRLSHLRAIGRRYNQPVMKWPMKAKYGLKIFDSLIGRHEDGENVWYKFFIYIVI